MPIRLHETSQHAGLFNKHIPRIPLASIRATPHTFSVCSTASDFSAAATKNKSNVHSINFRGES